MRSKNFLLIRIPPHFYHFSNNVEFVKESLSVGGVLCCLFEYFSDLNQKNIIPAPFSHANPPEFEDFLWRRVLLHFVLEHKGHQLKIVKDPGLNDSDSGAILLADFSLLCNISFLEQFLCFQMEKRQVLSQEVPVFFWETENWLFLIILRIVNCLWTLAEQSNQEQTSFRDTSHCID